MKKMQKFQRAAYETYKDVPMHVDGLVNFVARISSRGIVATSDEYAHAARCSELIIRYEDYAEEYAELQSMNVYEIRDFIKGGEAGEEMRNLKRSITLEYNTLCRLGYIQRVKGGLICENS